MNTAYDGETVRAVKNKTALFATPLLLFVAALTVARFYFLFTYSDVYAGAGIADIVYAFGRGLRFDLSITAIVSLPFMLALMFPGADGSPKFLRTVFTALPAWYMALLVYTFIDIHYYAFSQRHVTFELANTWRDADVMLKLGIREYMGGIVLLFAFLGVFAAVFHFAYGRLIKNCAARRRPRRELKMFAADICALVAACVLSAVFIRGGLQMKPLGVKNAFPSENAELGALSLNGLYTTWTTVYKAYRGQDPSAYLASLSTEEDSGETVKYITDPQFEDFEPGYPLYRKYRYSANDKRPLNVVIFIMESWSAKHMASLGGKISASPHFDELAKDGLLLTNFFANGQRSMEGLAAVLGSMPVWKGMILGQGGLLLQTRIEPIGSIFKKNGYETIFFHGARPGSMGFDGLVKRLGFNRHVSMDDFDVNEKTYDGVWGIYDEDVFLRAHEEFAKISAAGKRFFSVIYSLTSHSPYSIPSEKFRRFTGDVPYAKFLNSMAYTDYALDSFFKNAREAGYFKDTLFIVTADHTEGRSTSDTLYESYRIPFLLYAPGIVEPGMLDAPASQLDVVPTVLDVLKFSDPFTSWGKSVLHGGGRRIMLARGELSVFVDGPYMLLSDIETPFALYDYRQDPSKNMIDADNGETAKKLLGEARAYLRFSWDLITENRVKPPD